MIDLAELQALVEKYLLTVDKYSMLYGRGASAPEIAKSEMINFLAWLKAQQGESQEETETRTPFEREWTATQGRINAQWWNLMTPEDQAKIVKIAEHIKENLTVKFRVGPNQVVIFEGAVAVKEDDELLLNMETGTGRVQKTPAWSFTLPTEEGWYWCRNPQEEPDPIVTRVLLQQGRLYSSLHCEFLDELPQNRYRYMWQWWPIPLTAPGE